jgi:hypothetical protein
MFIYKLEAIIIFRPPLKIETYMSNSKFLICRGN